MSNVHTLKKCDRCGATWKFKGHFRAINYGSQFLDLHLEEYSGSDLGYSNTSADLCGNCATSLKEWYDNPE